MMDTVLNVLYSEKITRNSPIIVIFGHAHFDHIYQGLVDRRIESVGKPVYICHTAAMEPLINADAEYLQAKLVDLPVPSFRADIGIFSKRKTDCNFSHILPGFQLFHNELSISDDICLKSEELIFPRGQSLVFWDVPGHSPDSMAITAGEFIHLGDIPFATNPGVAGIIGYDPVELARTVRKIRWILNNNQLSLLCTGHGNPLTREMIEKILPGIERDLKTTPDIGVFDRNRVNISMHHAMDLIDEAHRIIPVLAGRIMALSFYMEELEEYELAEKIAGIIQDEEIDKLLSSFNDFYAAFTSGSKKEIEVVLKTLQVLQKISSYLPLEDMNRYIDVTLIRRCEHLFSDFLSTIRGVMPSATIFSINPADLIHSISNNRTKLLISDEELLESGDNHKLFQKALLCRLSDYQCHKTAIFHITDPDNPICMYADEDRLSDFFNTIINYFETYDARNISIEIKPEMDEVFILINPDMDCHPLLPLSPSLIRTVGYAGGRVIKLPSRDEEGVILAFPRENLYSGPDQDQGNVI